MNDQEFVRLKNKLKFNDQGLIPAIVQDAKTQKVLVLCYMNDTALRETVEKGFIYLYRRSAGQLQMKGGTSGHTQAVREFRIDCEGKSLLFIVDQKVACCHKGYFDCFFEKVEADGTTVLTATPVFDPKKVY